MTRGQHPKRLMQEALDERLTTQERRALFEHLDLSEKDYDNFDRLRQVDKLLKAAPQEHAPEGMASSILARIAAADTQPDPQAHPQPSTGYQLRTVWLALGLCAAAFILVPLLSAAVMLGAQAFSNGETITTSVQALTSLFTTALIVLHAWVNRAQTVLAQSTPLAAMLPLAMASMLLLRRRML